jgi:hypothetical protein
MPLAILFDNIVSEVDAPDVDRTSVAELNVDANFKPRFVRSKNFDSLQFAGSAVSLSKRHNPLKILARETGAIRPHY